MQLVWVWAKAEVPSKRPAGRVWFCPSWSQQQERWFYLRKEGAECSLIMCVAGGRGTGKNKVLWLQVEPANLAECQNWCQLQISCAAPPAVLTQSRSSQQQELPLGAPHQYQ